MQIDCCPLSWTLKIPINEAGSEKVQAILNSKGEWIEITIFIQSMRSLPCKKKVMKSKFKSIN